MNRFSIRKKAEIEARNTSFLTSPAARKIAIGGPETARAPFSTPQAKPTPSCSGRFSTGHFQPSHSNTPASAMKSPAAVLNGPSGTVFSAQIPGITPSAAPARTGRISFSWILCRRFQRKKEFMNVAAISDSGVTAAGGRKRSSAGTLIMPMPNPATPCTAPPKKTTPAAARRCAPSIAAAQPCRGSDAAPSERNRIRLASVSSKLSNGPLRTSTEPISGPLSPQRSPVSSRHFTHHQPPPSSL